MKKPNIIAVDFDGTLCENEWPKIGEPNIILIKYLKTRKDSGDKLILWTCRTGKLLDEAVEFCKIHELIFDAVNENLPETIKWAGGDSRKIWAHEYIDDKNNLMFELPFYELNKTWADNEVEIACKRENPDIEIDEFDYGCACYESALKAYKTLCRDGHTGFSISATKHILNLLIDGKPLTPIEDTDDIWQNVSNYSDINRGYVSYQCKRMSSLFKKVYPDGTVKYNDVDRCYGTTNVNNTDIAFHNGLVDKVIDELYPIQMPYYPESKPFTVVCEEFLTDKRNGDYDTIGMLYAITPKGDKVELKRYFKETVNDMVEIDESEYLERYEISKKLLEV